jgi:hypothetical protein
MVMSADINAVKKPTTNLGKSFKDSNYQIFNRSQPVAANIIGIAKKKENSFAVWHFKTNSTPPSIQCNGETVQISV